MAAPWAQEDSNELDFNFSGYNRELKWKARARAIEKKEQGGILTEQDKLANDGRSSCEGECKRVYYLVTFAKGIAGRCARCTDKWIQHRLQELRARGKCSDEWSWVNDQLGLWRAQHPGKDEDYYAFLTSLRGFYRNAATLLPADRSRSAQWTTLTGRLFKDVAGVEDDDDNEDPDDEDFKDDNDSDDGDSKDKDDDDSDDEDSKDKDDNDSDDEDSKDDDETDSKDDSRKRSHKKNESKKRSHNKRKRADSSDDDSEKDSDEENEDEEKSNSDEERSEGEEEDEDVEEVGHAEDVQVDAPRKTRSGKDFARKFKAEPEKSAKKRQRTTTTH